MDKKIELIDVRNEEMENAINRKLYEFIAGLEDAEFIPAKEGKGN